MTDTRTFRVVDEDGDYYEITGDPGEALAAAQRERDDDLCVMAAFLLPNRRPIEHWLAILANHFGSRAQELTQDPERFAAARFRVDHVPADTTPTTNDLES